MKKIFPLIIALGLVSCDKPKPPTETEQKQEDYKKKYPTAAKLLDSVITTPNGNYYKLIPDGVKKFKIEWGNSLVKKVSNDKYHVMTAETLRLDWESPDFIVLHNEYTKLGRYDYFLSLTGDSLEYIVENALLYDTARNLVVWEQPFKDVPIVIENYVTRKTQSVTEDQKCEAILIEFCLDSISLQKDILYYKLGLPRLDDKEKSFVDRRIEIKI
jgi:hypothetical protein